VPEARAGGADIDDLLPLSSSLARNCASSVEIQRAILDDRFGIEEQKSVVATAIAACDPERK
jgi:hypothetical protein